MRFESLPDDARVWVFAAAAPMSEAAESHLLSAVDDFLSRWNAHGAPLLCARDWRDRRFLAIGVDQSTAGASGCSIDGLFRTLGRLEPELGTSMLAGGRVYYRDGDGEVQSTTRSAFAGLVRERRVTADTPVFDTSLTTAGAWRESFERAMRSSWHADLARA